MSYYPGSTRGSRHAVAFVLFLMGIGLTVALYYVKTKAQSAKAQSARLERQVKSEKDAINVLRAEIAHLENPVRMDELARVELGLKPVDTDQVISVSKIEDKFPLKSDGELDD